MKKYPPRGTEFYDPAVECERPIFGIDIDGTLGVYHSHFINFAEAWLGRTLPPADGYTGGSFAKYLGLSKATYRKIKLAYRRGGLKRSMPVVPGASDLTRSLRQRGAIVVLCTTRPYLSLENVDEDTRHWAKRNRIAHDYIIWGEHKYRELARFGGRVVSVLEDEPALLRQAGELGLVAIRVKTPYNSDFPTFGVRHLGYAKEVMMGQLDRWERKNR